MLYNDSFVALKDGPESGVPFALVVDVSLKSCLAISRFSNAAYVLLYQLVVLIMFIRNMCLGPHKN